MSECSLYCAGGQSNCLFALANIHVITIFFDKIFSPRVFFIIGRESPTQWARASTLTKFLDHTQRRTTTVCRTPLDEWKARRRDLYLTSHNTHNRHTSMPPVRNEPTITACERPQTPRLPSRGHW